MRAILIAALLSLSVPAFGQDFDATLDSGCSRHVVSQYLTQAAHSSRVP